MYIDLYISDKFYRRWSLEEITLEEFKFENAERLSPVEGTETKERLVKMIVDDFIMRNKWILSNIGGRPAQFYLVFKSKMNKEQEVPA